MFKLILIFLIFYLIFTSGKTLIRSQQSKNPTFTGNPYDILGVSPHSTDEEIRNAYLESSKKNHPDLVTHMSSDFQKLAEEKLKEINWAYNEIKRSRGF